MGAIMDRNEVLERSRKENQLHDEGVQDAQQKGRRVGIAGFFLFVAIVVVYNMVLGINNPLPVAFMLVYLTCQAWGQYVERRDTIVLITGITGSVGTVAASAAYVMFTLM